MHEAQQLRQTANHLLQSAYLRSLKYSRSDLLKMQQLIDARNQCRGSQMDRFFWWSGQVQMEFQHVDPDLCQTLELFRQTWDSHINASSRQIDHVQQRGWQ